MAALVRRMVVCLLAWSVAVAASAEPGWRFIAADAHMAAPTARVIDRAGTVWQLDALRGRAVLLNFWASWCEPCVTEMPSLQALAARQGAERLIVLAVNFKQSAPSIDAFVQRTGLTLPVIADPQGDIARQWGVKIFPSTVLIDAQGRVHGVVQGELDWTGPAAATLLQPLLSQPR